MKYVIANLIMYDAEEGIICGYMDNASIDPQHLTNTANRILSLLIASPGEIIERNELLEQVWSSNGQVASNSSLNQYISILRKILTQSTGVGETIISHPRVGFSFSANLTVTVVEEEIVTEEIPARKNELTLDVIKENAPQKPQKRVKTTPGFLVPGALLILIIALVVAITQYPDENIETVTPDMSDLFSVDQCQIKSDLQTHSFSKESILNVITDFIPDLLSVCNKKAARIFFKAENSVFYNRPGRVYVAFCQLDNEVRYIMYCETFYAYNWKSS